MGDVKTRAEVIEVTVSITVDGEPEIPGRSLTDSALNLIFSVAGAAFGISALAAQASWLILTLAALSLALAMIASSRVPSGFRPFCWIGFGLAAVPAAIVVVGGLAPSDEPLRLFAAVPIVYAALVLLLSPFALITERFVRLIVDTPCLDTTLDGIRKFAKRTFIDVLLAPVVLGVSGWPAVLLTLAATRYVHLSGDQATVVVAVYVSALGTAAYAVKRDWSNWQPDPAAARVKWLSCAFWRKHLRFAN